MASFSQASLPTPCAHLYWLQICAENDRSRRERNLFLSRYCGIDFGEISLWYVSDRGNKVISGIFITLFAEDLTY